MRALLVEVQALVSPAVYGTPQRSSTGFDLRRLNMILAVLDKRCGFRFSSKDVFVNIAGGLRVEDPAIDLAVVAALLSSYDDTAIPTTVCFSGEVGLSGEIRAVNRIEMRVAEAIKLGYSKIFVSKYNQKIEEKGKVKMVKTVAEFYRNLFVGK
jgi:DNA repair protein RadA/Sms